MPLLFKFRRKRAGVVKAGRDDRSLGFIPLLLMTSIYLVYTIFADDIGPITSAPGFYRMNRPAPGRGCVIPRPSA
jgi:hypothetical protein